MLGIVSALHGFHWIDDAEIVVRKELATAVLFFEQREAFPVRGQSGVQFKEIVFRHLQKPCDSGDFSVINTHGTRPSTACPATDASEWRV